MNLILLFLLFLCFITEIFSFISPLPIRKSSYLLSSYNKYNSYSKYTPKQGQEGGATPPNNYPNYQNNYPNQNNPPSNAFYNNNQIVPPNNNNYPTNNNYPINSNNNYGAPNNNYGNYPNKFNKDSTGYTPRSTYSKYPSKSSTFSPSSSTSSSSTTYSKYKNKYANVNDNSKAGEYSQVSPEDLEEDQQSYEPDRFDTCIVLVSGVIGAEPKDVNLANGLSVKSFPVGINHHFIPLHEQDRKKLLSTMWIQSEIWNDFNYEKYSKEKSDFNTTNPKLEVPHKEYKDILINENSFINNLSKGQIVSGLAVLMSNKFTLKDSTEERKQFRLRWIKLFENDNNNLSSTSPSSLPYSSNIFNNLLKSIGDITNFPLPFYNHLEETNEDNNNKNENLSEDSSSSTSNSSSTVSTSSTTTSSPNWDYIDKILN